MSSVLVCDYDAHCCFCPNDLLRPRSGMLRRSDIIPMSLTTHYRSCQGSFYVLLLEYLAMESVEYVCSPATRHIHDGNPAKRMSRFTRIFVISLPKRKSGCMVTLLAGCKPAWQAPVLDSGSMTSATVVHGGLADETAKSPRKSPEQYRISTEQVQDEYRNQPPQPNLRRGSIEHLLRESSPTVLKQPHRKKKNHGKSTVTSTIRRAERQAERNGLSPLAQREDLRVHETGHVAGQMERRAAGTA